VAEAAAMVLPLKEANNKLHHKEVAMPNPQKNTKNSLTMPNKFHNNRHNNKSILAIDII